MQINGIAIFSYIHRLKTRLRKSGLPRGQDNEQLPLRSALFNDDQMEQHGKHLAATHKLAVGRARDQLLTRLAANEEVLVDVRNLLADAVAANHRITPAGEWLLDNFYLIEEQIRTAKLHLPEGYSRELPRLAHFPSAGLPRVYDIALEAISHGDGRVDKESLSRFVAAYQTVAPLKLGELWAIPIMLRLALIENIRAVGARIAAGRVDRNIADAWADRMTDIAEKDPKSLILIVADMARSNPPMSAPFVSEITRRLQGQGPALALPLTWIEQRLFESDLTIERLVQSGNQGQAADQVSISNSIGSLRFLAAMDWQTFVETMSVVEQTLSKDPTGVYGQMDFATRDHYRHATERLAKRSHLSEAEVAERAIQLANLGATSKGIEDRTAHVGFYLTDKGLPLLEQTAEAALSFSESMRRASGKFPLPLYLGAIALITVALTSGLLTIAYDRWYAPTLETPIWMRAIVSVLALFSTSQLAVALVNWLATLLASPHQLPRLDFSKGIPSEFRTLVIVPTMLTSTNNINDLIEGLEVRFLANRDDTLHFGLLTDFKDAHQEILPEDEALLDLAQQKIDELNEKYSGSRRDAFFLFHRPRRWNAQERIWMGYERKRGKLADLNSFLRGGPKDHFSRIVGETAVLSNVKYVITLDTDTQLPRDSARQFVGAMAHPLNRPRYDEEKQRVSEGYGILQPRVMVSLPGTNRSLYARLHGGEAGIDPYTRASSDVYQDIFQEGSFIGKGIYDVDAFERSLGGRFAENQILSHDLLEGCYARSGLLSDVELQEEYPARYSADVSRRHRWIRGDWQLVGWLLPRVRGGGARREKNPLSRLSIWKIADNLRRSLVPLAMTFLLLLGWTILSPIWLSTVAVMGIILIPLLMASTLEVFRKPKHVLLRQHLTEVVKSTERRLAHAAFSLVCLPYEAFQSLDAILRTACRMLVTHKRLLEWNPSGDHAASDQTTLVGAFRAMWIGPVTAFATLMYLTATRPAALAVASPILILWFASPAIAAWLSSPLTRREAKCSASQMFFLRKLSRRTWAFFETFVGPQDNWLPPDNYQEHPVDRIAHRTSPTNIGMALLANLTAYDFGYIPIGQLITRTTNTLNTMQSLERHRGHFYNWYDTQSLQPLLPMYISTVDSGNLAAHLLTLLPGLQALPNDRILEARFFDGLKDTLGILVDVVGETKLIPLAPFEKELELATIAPPATLAEAWLVLDRLATLSSDIERSIDANNESKDWAQALAKQCHTALNELIFLAPWVLLQALPALRGEGLFGNAPIPTLRELARLESELCPIIESQLNENTTAERRNELEELRRLIIEASTRAADQITAIDRLALQVSEFAVMEYEFLYDKTRHLLTIGYNVDERRIDSSYYDLLASEARLCSFVGIAQGQLPQESWFALGRLLTVAGGDPILLSWSGSMFEYLMPLLVMPTYENTLLDQTYKAAVERQIEYGKQRGVAWGISESGYNTVDASLNYQYSAFGAPGLGLKRGLADDLVIAPYASVLALMVAPEEACLNLQRLAVEGLLGKYGFYEAVDYTPSRLPRGQSSAVVRSFMAHHLGMSFLSLAYLLLNRPMQKRFQSDPAFQATLLLLQERIPRTTAFYSHSTELSEIRTISSNTEMPVRVLTTPDTPVPEVQLLSNGRYHVMVTNAGGGYSRWKDLAVTRWREDTTRDNWGTFCYIRDVANRSCWSTAHQPMLKRAAHYEAIFSEGRAEFRRRDDDFDTHTEIVVSPEDDIELRRVRITNRSRMQRVIDVTSYAEVVLAPPVPDAMHPAFSNLFVQTEIIGERQAILCTRRPRSFDEDVPWMLHLMTVHGAEVGEISYETDRLQFIGRGNTPSSPQAMNDFTALTGSQGSVLDPIVAIRAQMTLDPDQTVIIDMVSGVSDTRDGAVTLVEKYQDRRLADRVFELAWTHSQVVLRQINATEADAQLYGRLASSVVYANASLRADASVLLKNRRGQSGLWGYAISGDIPIVLLQIKDSANIDLVRQLVQAHAYWRLKGLAVDLVIWNEDHNIYRQRLQEHILGLITSGVEAHVIDRPGGIFVRHAEQISTEDRVLFQAVARAIITDGLGTLEEQINRDKLNRRSVMDVRVPRFKAVTAYRSDSLAVTALPKREVILSNGLGGFTPDGSEYVITLEANKATPAPWVNVLANPRFGTVISENGLAYTWYENAHQYRLTPWGNDPVSDSGGEAFYIRDEESGHFWSPTALPARGTRAYVVRHGFGYSVFEHSENGIHSELTVYVALDAAIKFSVLKVRNDSGRARRLSATGFVEWVLGDLRPKTAMHVTTEIDPKSGALYARNAYNTDFADWTAFFDADDANRTTSCDRAEFIGRNGSLENPAAMGRSRLSGKVGAGLDPCAAIQIPFDLADGQSREIVFRLGVGENAGAANALVHRFHGPGAARIALEAVRRHWVHTLSAVRIETPDDSLNVLTNGWLVYQTMACRLWARSGYYQSGGAFGFRDQLQDVMALIHAEPKLAREHLLLCASRQFREGDVQHWWHPPSGRGVRSHCSDDYLWLPLATCRYVLSTGDTGILDTAISFLDGRQVNPQDDSYYDLPARTEETASLYRHCVLAILRGLQKGEHGLPLIGTGDWNDGMNMVGKNGKGESVWLGFFLCEVLKQFAKLARLYGDAAFAEQCDGERSLLTENIEQSAWDGGWYRRAYFDDGTPLGSTSNDECQIDSISQSWSVLSGAGNPQRARTAMKAVDERLVRRDKAIIQLLDPPFDKSNVDPGYIRGYVPGVRENGGQYTHGAVWAAMAFAALGDSKRAWELTAMINPINHARSEEETAIYKAEPYVVAADVYGVAPHIGRGGWSWYTGSAGWMYRLILESLLGLRLEGDKLYFTPCIPAEWKAFKIHYRYRDTMYHITVSQTLADNDQTSVRVDGADVSDNVIHLVNDQREHTAEIRICRTVEAISATLPSISQS